MWFEITDKNSLLCFMKRIDYFHDSCLKELKYTSGAFVNEDLSMHPINDQRVLTVVFQQQREESPMIELEFSELKYMKLIPIGDQYTCELLDATLMIDNDSFYWADMGGLSVEGLKLYDGTVICASKLRWRFVDGNMGNEDYYRSGTQTIC